MRTVKPAYAPVRTALAALRGLRRKRLNVDEMSDYMLRDIGFIDGRPHCEADFVECDGRFSHLDLLTPMRFAS